MFVAMFVANMPDNGGAFFSDLCLARELRRRGHTVFLVNMGKPATLYSGGEYEGFRWKPFVSAGKELDQSQIWLAPHYPRGPHIRRLNAAYRRPIIFTLHFSGAVEMFRSPVQITWKETFWYVNSQIPRILMPQGFPNHVTAHHKRFPFVNPEDSRVDSPGEYIALINANLNKGLALFLEIAKRMPHHKFLGVRSYYHAPYQTLLEVPPNIEWVDFTRDLKSLYSKIRVLLVPSVYESFCVVALESFHNGIPVLYSKPRTDIVTAPPGSTEGVEEWIAPAGIACDARGPDEWVEALHELDDPDAYQAKSDEVRVHAQTVATSASQGADYVESFSRANPVETGRAFKIQNAPPPRESEPVPTAIPRPPVGARIGWQNGRLSFARR